MQFIRLTGAVHPNPVWVDPKTLGVLEVCQNLGGEESTAIYTRLYHMFIGRVQEPPAEIIQRAAAALGNDVDLIFPAPEPDAVDVAIDEAYARGQRDTLELVQEALDKSKAAVGA